MFAIGTDLVELARHGLAIQVETALAHFHDIAFDTDHALDEIARRRLALIAEHDDIAALRIVPGQASVPAFRQDVADPQRQGVHGIAIGPFGHGDPVTDFQRGLHAFGRNVEGGEPEGHQAQPDRQHTAEKTDCLNNFTGSTPRQALHQGIHFSFTAVP